MWDSFRLKLLAVLLAVCLLSNYQPASAHGLVQDSTGKVDAILHVVPDDNPVAGELTVLHYEVEPSVSMIGSTATLTITNSEGLQDEINVTTGNRAAVISYTFPAAGSYGLKLLVMTSGSKTLNFSSQVEVNSAKAAEPTTSTAAIIWLSTSTAVLVTLLIAYFLRRKNT